MKTVIWCFGTFILVAFLLSTCGCTTAYHPNGNVALRTSADSASLMYSSAGTSLTIIGHKPSSNTRAVGSVAGTILTGAVGLRIPVP